MSDTAPGDWSDPVFINARLCERIGALERERVDLRATLAKLEADYVLLRAASMTLARPGADT